MSGMWMRIRTVNRDGKAVEQRAKVIVPKAKNAVPEISNQYPACRCPRCI
ncbi:hypothetical protein J7E96_02360 [Streptomyces sp. ISL-96]|nr:hypothetical protein [Streptomyces sp. ISL-96]MBT2487401.1 hypothetical protein [Streptomyces sp. ISL-96]